MTKEFLASLLNEREYRDEISQHEVAEAQKHGLVIAYGASDDLMEFDGAIRDEVGAHEGTTVMVDKEGILSSWEDFCHTEEDEAEYEKYFQRKPNGKEITANWDDDGYSWTYTTDIPHSTFDIMEDGEKYCRGIVFSINDL
jgi:hypothetical protein